VLITISAVLIFQINHKQTDARAPPDPIIHNLNSTHLYDRFCISHPLIKVFFLHSTKTGFELACIYLSDARNSRYLQRI
jgi:hypothetical protein